MKQKSVLNRSAFNCTQITACERCEEAIKILLADSLMPDQAVGKLKLNVVNCLQYSITVNMLFLHFLDFVTLNVISLLYEAYDIKFHR